jgi:transcriptional regulator with XRE-family HTH domain
MRSRFAESESKKTQGGTKMNFKISLEAARTNAGLTQKEVAKALGKSNKTVCSWEKGKSFPNAMEIDALCKLYGVSYDNINFLPNDSL